MGRGAGRFFATRLGGMYSVTNILNVLTIDVTPQYKTRMSIVKVRNPMLISEKRKGWVAGAQLMTAMAVLAVYGCVPAQPENMRGYRAFDPSKSAVLDRCYNFTRGVAVEFFSSLLPIPVLREQTTRVVSIDGMQVGMQISPQLEIDAGPHLLTISHYQQPLVLPDSLELPVTKQIEISFVAEGKKSYRAGSYASVEKIYAWVEDSATGAVVAGNKPAIDLHPSNVGCR